MASGPLRCSTRHIRLQEVCHVFLAAFLRSPSRLRKSGWCILMFIEIPRKQSVSGQFTFILLNDNVLTVYTASSMAAIYHKLITSPAECTMETESMPFIYPNVQHNNRYKLYQINKLLSIFFCNVTIAKIGGKKKEKKTVFPDNTLTTTVSKQYYHHRKNTSEICVVFRHITCHEVHFPGGFHF